MKKIISIVLILFGAAATFLSSLLICAIPVLEEGANSSWMAKLSDSTKISALSLPGSHDSGATHSIADFSGKCQDYGIKPQLQMGVRFFDIRLKNSGGNLRIMHGFIDQKLSYDTFLDEVNAFINTHEKETIFLSIKNEATDSGTSEEFASAVLSTSKAHLGEKWAAPRTMPTTIGEVRGKVVLLSRFQADYGVDCYSGWPGEARKEGFDIDNGIHVQDYYALPDCEAKKASVLECLSYANQNATTGASPFVLNFFSGYLENAFPMSYSVPVAKQMNPFALEQIKNYSTTGVCIFDFVNEKLCEAVIGRNAI